MIRPDVHAAVIGYSRGDGTAVSTAGDADTAVSMGAGACTAFSTAGGAGTAVSTVAGLSKTGREHQLTKSGVIETASATIATTRAVLAKR